MHIETIKTFCDLVDSGSFSKAARKNLVSQSAVSQQLRALETRYDRRLLERGPGCPVVLTEAGRLLYSEGKAILERFQALEQRLKHNEEVITGTVRVATVYSVGLHVLPPFVKQFLAEHPQVNVRVEYSRTDRVYEACLNGTIDFGIVAQPLRRAQLEVIPLNPEPLVLVCSPDHRLARSLGRPTGDARSGRRRTITIDQLQGESFVAFDRTVPTRKVIDRLLKEHQVSVSVVTEFDNIETIKRSVEAGLGVSILPQNCVKNEAKARTLVPLTFSDGPFTRSIGIIHRRGRELSATVRAFMELLTDGLGRG